MPLRLRDRSQFGREIDCPDCGTRLRIVADRGEVRAERATEPVGLELPKTRSSRSTLRLIWGVTACLGVGVVWYASRPAKTEPLPREITVEQAEPAGPEPAPQTAIAPQAVVEEPKEELPPVVVAPVVEPPKPAAAQTPPVVAVPPDDPPLMPELAPDQPVVDVAAQLSLKIDEYSQVKPAPVRLLLRQIAELSAVPVDLSEVEAEPWKTKLDQAISVELKATTVGGVLEEVLKQAGLGSRQQDGVIFVVPEGG
ncbi:hypothetical protein Pan44_31910 [Caulifigura coniformis]|uniref:Uncharacterized protein n=1 Tax=Caulifigura coniformis TaxID=2527983 RepID=A0A517SG96_9PLAN|nr:STN domain-containing protein [Caulifigura coniformis]QDT55149.1 hypothetical protein Pan44_31910 [Caulifigura coniformis]